MEGGEAGLNEKGVAIGNEAVFPKLRTRADGVLGMDLLRAALAGCGTAREAVDFITCFTERNDQGGNIRIHPLSPPQSRVDTLFIQRRSAHQYSALQGFVSCLENNSQVIAA